MAKETAAPLRLSVDFSYPFHIKNEAEDTSIDITGWALSWMVKANLSDLDAAAILTKTTADGIAIAGTFDAIPARNTQLATVTVADTDTDRLSRGLYVYELKRTDAGLETTLASGTIEFIRTVHRA